MNPYLNLSTDGNSSTRFPADPEALSAGWITTVLRDSEALTNALVSSIQIDRLGGTKGAMGRIVRVSLDYDREERVAPRSLIAKFASDDADMRDLGNALGLYTREVNFYNVLATEIGLPTPRCYFARMNPSTGASLLVLEDLAFAHNGDRIAACSPAEADRALQTVAKLHAAWWQHPRLAALQWLQPFDTHPLQATYQRSWRPFVAKMGTRLSAPLHELGERLGANLSAVFEHYWAAPWTLIHNDYHLDNLFFGTTAASHALTVIDWQSVLRGQGMLDVAGFLGGNLSVADRRDHELRLLQSYHATLTENGVRGYDFDQCLIDYRAALFDGLSRLVIALASNLREEQERAHRDVLWVRFSTAIVDLDAGELLHRF